MKFLHISDLHIGKRLIERSLIDDQRHILRKIENIVAKNNFDGVLIAGDIYDKAIPSAEAVDLFNDFLTNLVEKNVKVFVISGNHDSPERIGFASKILSKAGVYMSPAYNGKIDPIKLEDGYGHINIYLLPYIKPSYVRQFHPMDEISTYNEALKIVVDDMDVNKNERNILLAHQFLGHAEKDGSEEASIGGMDIVDESIFTDFDYVALGHIHKKQTIKNKMRYSGTPLKYSFSENKNQNSVTIVEIKDKGKLTIDEIELEPKRNLVEIKGKFKELTSKEYYDKLNKEDYYRIILTDENDIVDGAAKLRNVYPFMLRLDYDNKRTKTRGSIKAVKEIENKSTLELFAEFYEKQNGLPMSKSQETFMNKTISNIEEAK